MQPRAVSLFLVSALLLASCGRQATPPGALSAPAVPPGVTLTQEQQETARVFEQTLTDLRQARARVAAGARAPLDAQGQPIDLDALITKYEATLGTVGALRLPGSVRAQSDLYVTFFPTIYRDDNFQANDGNWTHEFPAYDWSTDGCSGPAKYTGYADNFYWPCVQHDFGYRNNRRAGMHNESTRLDIDVSFLRHMNNLCSRYSFWAKPACYAAASTFYDGVRLGGWSSFY